MGECFRCGVSSENARLFDAVSSEGIVKVCVKCASEEHIPLIKKPTTSQIKESEKTESYRDAVAKHQIVKRNDLRDKENMSLRDIVDMNLKIPGKEENKPRPDLIDNFHWKISRARRMKHVSREQFAKDLGESETLIKMIENGILPEDDNKIINKIESYLGINLRKPGFRKSEEKKIGFDSISVKNLTISNLREMRENKFSKSAEVWRDDEEQDKFSENFEKDKDLSDEEMDDLIFGRKK